MRDSEIGFEGHESPNLPEDRIKFTPIYAIYVSNIFVVSIPVADLLGWGKRIHCRFHLSNFE